MGAKSQCMGHCVPGRKRIREYQFPFDRRENLYCAGRRFAIRWRKKCVWTGDPESGGVSGAHENQMGITPTTTSLRPAPGAFYLARRPDFQSSPLLSSPRARARACQPFAVWRTETPRISIPARFEGNDAVCQSKKPVAYLRPRLGESRAEARQSTGTGPSLRFDAPLGRLGQSGRKRRNTRLFRQSKACG